MKIKRLMPQLLKNMINLILIFSRYHLGFKCDWKVLKFPFNINLPSIQLNNAFSEWKSQKLVWKLWRRLTSHQFEFAIWNKSEGPLIHDTVHRLDFWSSFSSPNARLFYILHQILDTEIFLSFSFYNFHPMLVQHIFIFLYKLILHVCLSQQ